MDRLINKLGLEDMGEEQNGNYVINLEDSNEFSYLYTLIADEFDGQEPEDGNTYTDDETYVVFTDGEVEVTCQANYNTDRYSITIGDR